MEQGTDEIFSYIKQLPPHMRDAVLAMDWLPHVDEIGQKYSLTEEQVGSVIYEVLFVLSGMEDEDNLTENIKEELDVSSVLAEQIHEDIKTRVIGFLLKKVEQKERTEKYSKNESGTAPESSSEIPTGPIADVSQKEMLDIPPTNLPGEVIEGNSDVVSEANQPSTPIPLQNPSSSTFIQTKLSQITTSTHVAPETTTPHIPPQFIPNKSYETDPYREPLE